MQQQEPTTPPPFDVRDFIAAEGQYNLREDIFMDSLVPNLAIGTATSIVTVKYKEYPGHATRLSSSSSSGDGDTISAIDRVGEHMTGGNDSGDEDTVYGHSHSVSTSATLVSSTREPNFTHARSMTINTALANAANMNLTATPTNSPTMSPKVTSLEGGKSASDETTFSALFGSGKRKKPKNNITKTNSSFVARINTNENLAKILASQQGDAHYLFYSVGKCFVWTDMRAKPDDFLSRIIFTRAFPTSHDVNPLTRGVDHMDVIIGFSSGDCIWFDPLCNKYYRLNKGGIMNSHAVTCVRWMPGSENLFMASFTDGSVMVFDKERDDATHSIPSDKPTDHHPFGLGQPHPTAPPLPPQTNSLAPPPLVVWKQQKGSRYNPLVYYKLTCNKSIISLALSPDHIHVSFTTSTGHLHVLNHSAHLTHSIYTSYFGGLTCTAWSPDGKYILTGGQDDLVTIWAFREQRIVARCQGHQSWVTGVAFDPWRCDDTGYRFGSVGEDCRILLWDFSGGVLHRPKAFAANRRGSATSIPTPIQSPTSPKRLSAALPDPRWQPSSDVLVYPVLPKSEVSLLQPVMSKVIHADPLCGLAFREDGVITWDRKGRVKCWMRPGV